MGLTCNCREPKGRDIVNTSNHIEKISNDSLLNLVQLKTFGYFWNGADPISGMARERIHIGNESPVDDNNVVTIGGTGFGVMAIIVGIERGFITREDGLNRLLQIVDFLKKTDRYHGAWPHWIYSETGKTKPFSQTDDGADIVETAFLMQGLLTARQYFKNNSAREELLVSEIDKLWREVNWNWFTKGGENVLYWHWSPNFGWEKNHRIRGWDECFILYILAASSPTFPIDTSVYHKGWAWDGKITSSLSAYNLPLGVKHNHNEIYGGPLFWSHYSFLGLDPRNLKDQYANYWDVVVNHTLINRQWCLENPLGFKGYGRNCWGLTSSNSINGYFAHAPGYNRDVGVISPTAALSSFPYTPEYSMEVLHYLYYELGDRLMGEYGFYDAFSIHHNWFPKKYLAIDQGPIVIMIENYRSGLCWNLFMSSPEIKLGLKKLGFSF